MNNKRWYVVREFFWIFLLPCSFIWAFITYLRRVLFSIFSKKVDSFVICVGNIHSGGSGKTPIVIELCEKLLSQNPIVVSRGYGRKGGIKEGLVDNSVSNGVDIYGDEPWMISSRLKVPVYVGKNRKKLISLIEKTNGKSLIIMDDGFQHLRIRKDISIVCINTEKIPEESFCIPYGELREPFSALKYASAVLLLSNDANNWKKLLTHFVDDSKIFFAKKRIDGIFSGSIQPEINTAVGCFCGIANPVSFFSDVRQKYNVVFEKTYSDHHRYTKKDLNDLVKLQNELKVRLLITTEKDWYKVISGGLSQNAVAYLKVGYDIENTFWDFLLAKCFTW